jgi:tetratricopeptide (TPR) repeat protein
LIEAGELKAVRRRHAQYYQLMFETADAERRGMAINEWLAVYGREIDNVRAAIDWGFSDEGDAAIAATLSADSTGLMYDLSLVGECRRRAEQALLAIKAGVQISPRSEMQLLASLQASRVYTDGPSPEGVAAWERVLAIATQLGEDDYQCRSLWGLWNDNIYSGSPERALIFAKQLADHPTSQSSPAGVTTAELLGSRTIGIALHYCGDQIAAARHLEFVLSHYVLRDHRWKTLGSRLDHATVTRATLARILWLRGYPEQARQMTDLALQQAIADDHSMSILYILVEAAIPLSLFSGELKRARSFVATLLEQAPRTGFRNWQATGRAFTALLLTSESDRRADLTALSDAVRELDDIGYCAHLTMYLGALARVQASSGRSSDADETVDRALARSAAHAEHWFRAELLRIKSDIAVQRGDDETAISLLHQALDLAREQGARSWELRAATSLARLLLRQGRAGEVRTILAPVFAWFTEGFETADLCAASACLAEIEAPGTR